MGGITHRNDFLTPWLSRLLQSGYMVHGMLLAAQEIWSFDYLDDLRMAQREESPKEKQETGKQRDKTYQIDWIIESSSRPDTPLFSCLTYKAK